jgi:hypothetical protein
MKTTASVPAPPIGAAGVLARMRSRVGPHLGPLVLLACLPAMLAFLNDYWPFTSSQAAFIDPWLYPSYFLHLKAQLLAFPTGYYGDRLSEILPGWALYHLFGPWIGNFILKLSVIYTTAFTAYFLLHDLFGKRVALVCGSPDRRTALFLNGLWLGLRRWHWYHLLRSLPVFCVSRRARRIV